MSKAKVLMVVALGFATGVFLASVAEVDMQAVYGVMAGLAAMLALAYKAQHRLLIYSVIFLLAAGLGILRLNSTFVENEYREVFGQKLSLEGLVAEDPDVRADKQMLTVQPEGHGQRVLITTTLAKEFFYGDKVVIFGKLDEPKAFEDFDYPMYLERFHVYGVMRYPQVLILKSHQGNWLKEQILRFKFWYMERIFSVLPKPHGDLMAGILIGARKGLPQNITDDFNATGISHVVAISGYNITIIIIAINYLAWVLGRRASFYLGLMVLIGFIILTGGSASVVRASVMGFLLLLANVIGRQYRILNALVLAAFVMLLQNPRILFWDIGFQLSFMATLGIVLLMPHLENLTKRLYSLWGAKELLLTTMSAIAATLPLVLLNFGRLSLVAPLVNLLVLPVVPATMLFGALCALPLLGAGFGLLAGWLLGWMLFISRYFAGLKFSSLNIEISGAVFLLLILAQLILYFLIRGLSVHSAKKINSLAIID